jgi:hypothetical protein
VYAISSEGKRICCGHPLEEYTIQAVTDMGWSEAKAAGRVGFNSYCICVDCLEQCVLDDDRDPLCCSKCEGVNVKTARSLVGQPCPKCKTGQIARIPTGWIS